MENGFNYENFKLTKTYHYDTIEFLRYFKLPKTHYFYHKPIDWIICCVKLKLLFHGIVWYNR